MKQKPKLFVIIPSIYRILEYNTHTKEVYYEGTLYATIQNQIYTRKFSRKYREWIYWDLALISYFHPKLFIVDTPKFKTKMTYEHLKKVGVVYTHASNFKGLLRTNLSEMTQINI